MKVPKILCKVGHAMSNASPQLLLIAGVATLGASVVIAVKETKKAEIILDEQAAKHDEITEQHSEEEQDSKEVKHAHTKVAVQTAGRLAWNYKFAALTFAAGTTMIGAGFGILRARYVKKVLECNALSATAHTLKRSYDAVIDRVRDKWGDEGVKYAKYGITQEEYVEETTDEKGKTHREKKTRDRGDRWAAITTSPWTIVFDEESNLYQQCGGSIVHMRDQLVAYQGVLNEQYNAGSPIFFNDIVRWTEGNDSPYLCDEGQICGNYKFDPENRAAGDDCIDLRINTFYGTDPESGEDKIYLMIDPNIAGPVCLDAPKRIKRNFGGKYISQTHF